MKSEKYEIIIGFIPGYKSDDEITQEDMIPISKFCSLYQKISEENALLKVSGVIDSVVTVYSTQYGCLVGGEPCYRITCQRNPTFDSDPSLFRKAVMENVTKLKQTLRQSTVTVSRSEVDVTYLTSKSE